MTSLAPAPSTTDAVRVTGIGKRFPGVIANHDISFTIPAGTIHALVGENGAGKSTLMKILYGVQKPDAGTVEIDGRQVDLSSPADAIGGWPATSDNASLVNEQNALTIKGEKMTVVCKQIAGVLARRIVCWKRPGDGLELGERFGLIKFGSRTDLVLPQEVEVLVNI